VSRSDEDLTEADTRSDETERSAGRGKVLAVSIASVVVLVVAGVVIYLLTSGDDSDDKSADGRDVPTITGSPAPTTPEPSASGGATVAPPATATGATGAPVEVQDAQSVAEQAATAISGADVAALNKLSCDPGNAATDETFPADAKAEVVGKPKVTGDTATVDLKLTIGDSEPTTVPMPLTKKDGRWCVP
jgi:flagellar basal body-associated protein FliL